MVCFYAAQPLIKNHKLPRSWFIVSDVCATLVPIGFIQRLCIAWCGYYLLSNIKFFSWSNCSWKNFINTFTSTFSSIHRLINLFIWTSKYGYTFWKKSMKRLYCMFILCISLYFAVSDKQIFSSTSALLIKEHKHVIVWTNVNRFVVL